MHRASHHFRATAACTSTTTMYSYGSQQTQYNNHIAHNLSVDDTVSNHRKHHLIVSLSSSSRNTVFLLLLWSIICFHLLLCFENERSFFILCCFILLRKWRRKVGFLAYDFEKKLESNSKTCLRKKKIH